MARKKRLEGREAAAVIRAFPGCVPITTYEQFVCLYLNVEWARVSRILEVADGVLIGSERGIVPTAWIDLMTDDPIERAKWRNREWAKESRGR